jgi:hypothetical protein
VTRASTSPASVECRPSAPITIPALIGLRAAVDVRELGAFDAPARAAQQLDDAEAVTDAGAGLDRGVDEHAVEQRTPRREEPGHGRPSA